MSVSLVITGGPSFTNLPWTSGMTGQSVLEVAYNSLSVPVTSYEFTLEYYGSSLGYLVNMINGTFDSFNSSQTPFFFWEFLVNDVVQDYGIDQTQINDNDVVTFSFVSFDTASNTSKLLNAKFERKSQLAKLESR